MSGDGGGFHGFMDDRLRALGRTRFIAVSVQQYHLAPPVLEATDCVCALPERFFMCFADRLDLLPLPVAVGGFTLAAACHPRLQAGPAHRWLRDALFAVVRRRADEPGPQPESQPGDDARAAGPRA
ncbi:hypothetical protein [Burkholderia sp. BDU5]|uniref:hypothetical protein n=1 Tax=Burkholderia sp. BDU5 TaxID=1385590 RepID=UPI000ABCAA8F|nr:hypothetical protein [Burkholderia sp. BDU5]